MKAAAVIACCVLAPALAVFAAQDPTPPGDGKPATESEATVTLPFTADNVWFRTAKFRLGLAWESKGELTVTESSLEYTHKKGTLRIGRESIQSVSEGMLPPDMSNVWVIVRYAQDGRELVAAFSTPPFRVAKQESLLAAIRAMMMMPTTAPAGGEERPVPTPELVAAERSRTKPSPWCCPPCA